MTIKKEKQYIVEQVMVTGYVIHTNGRKTPFAFNKDDLNPNDLLGIFDGVRRIFK